MRILTFVATSLLLTTACQKTETPPEGGAGAAKLPDGPSDKPGDKAGDDKPADPKPEAKADPLAGWFDYTGPDSAYTAKFPAKPQENTETMPVEGLPPQTMRSALYEGPGGTKAFITAVVDVNAPAGTTYDVPEGLKGAVEGMLSGMNATQDSTKDMNIGAAMGREVTFHGSMDGTSFKGVARVYAIGGEKPRLFQANTLAVGADITDDMRLFLDNFKPNVPAEAAGAATKDAAAPVAGEWVEHDGGAYKAKFPAKPEVQESPMPTVIGERKMQLAVSANDNGGFMVGTVDMQVPDGTPFDATQAIEGARDGLVKAVAGDVKPVESDIEMKGLKGKEFKFEAAGKGPGGSDVQGVARVLIDEKGGKRVFTLVAVGKKPLDEKAVAQFFDSFETKESGAAAAVEPGAGAATGNLGPSCKKFIDTYTACLDKMPEAMRAPAKDGLKQMQDAWSKVPDAAMMESACKQAWDAAKSAMGAVCPDVKWE